MRLLIMGPPGAGKGTHAKLLCKEYNIVHISTGDMFRTAIKLGTAEGMIAKQFIDKGNLVPDDIVIGIVREKIQENECNNGFLLDGFPRNIEQAKSLDIILDECGVKIDAVLNLQVSDDILIKRISGRRVCSKCGETYHVVNHPPKVEGICDVCGGNLVQRKDDTEETIKTRLKIYNKQTKPLLKYYEKQNLLKNLNGVEDINLLFNNIKKLLGGMND
ncbi:MAG: adenylate kinase [Bacilli bacterium]|nr:adenylate kinase [Bacilli bacterium]MDD2681986.1 adenylate kinase [Bacilli bacterium]MDD3120980.1 adenylate kinase [Bacilli bacterium]MDD4063154.1 adenylate kinase [Bacilli bacterium]MDD4481794.1 adenylate kinase [Bacilli bacterium]